MHVSICDSRAQLLNKFPPLTSLHAQVPGNRSQLFDGGGENTVKFPAGLWDIWPATNLEQLTTPPETREYLMHSGNARCKCAPLHPSPFPDALSADSVLVYGEIHTLYSSHLLSADARVHSRAHIHTPRQRKLKSLVTIIRLKASSIVHNLLRLVLPN